MKAIPALDLRDGACVQLVGGSYDEERVRIADPVAVATGWRARGFDTLHLVDLDAATGRGDNHEWVMRVIAAFGGAVQVGGGIRDRSDIERVIAAGATRVVVGTRAIEDPEWLADVASRFPGRLVLAADARDGAVVTRGWTHVLPLTVEALLARVAALPLAAALVTSVEREGRMTGPDLTLYQRLVRATRLPLIASGGIASLADLHALAAQGVTAAVLGMALYTGSLDTARLAEEFAA